MTEDNKVSTAEENADGENKAPESAPAAEKPKKSKKTDARIAELEAKLDK